MLKKIFNIKKDVKELNKRPAKAISDKSGAENSEKTYLGMSNNKKAIFMPNDAKHVFVCGTTGSGKTVALSNFIKSGADNNYGMLIVDGKGDIGANSILDITEKLGQNQKRYIINLNEPEKSAKYNPFRNANPSMIKDMLIDMTNWTEEHYKLNTERYLQRLINLIYKSEIPLSFTNIIKSIPIDVFLKISAELEKTGTITKEEHAENVKLAKISGNIAENASARFGTIAESDVGTIFTQTGIDIQTALQESAIILFILNPLIYPVLSPLIARLILIDSKKAVQKLFGNEKRTFFIFDEINTYASSAMLDLVNKSRSANVTCILATQSLSDLDFAQGAFFKEQIIENCNNYIVLRQNSAVNAENWANILGTRNNLDVTFQITNRDSRYTEDTGYGSARRVREFLYHPDEIKTFSRGIGVFMCKDNNSHSKITINKPF
jgi:type IV secretory pathway TraG/TraD family ATPase VirD4